MEKIPYFSFEKGQPLQVVANIDGNRIPISVLGEVKAIDGQGIEMADPRQNDTYCLKWSDLDDLSRAVKEDLREEQRSYQGDPLDRKLLFILRRFPGAEISAMLSSLAVSQRGMTPIRVESSEPDDLLNPRRWR